MEILCFLVVHITDFGQIGGPHGDLPLEPGSRAGASPFLLLGQVRGKPWSIGTELTVGFPSDPGTNFWASVRILFLPW